jgi:acetyl esterase
MQKMDEQTRLFLERINSNAAPPMERMSIEEIRRYAEQSVVASSIPLESISNIKISTAQTDIPLRIYVPKGTKPFPVFVAIHGGGWALGGLDAFDPFCRMIAEQAEVIVVSVDHRLAPEHKYPAGLDDCDAAADWVATHIREWGGDPAHLGIGGTSSGGNLAAAVVLRAKKQKFPVFQTQVLVCPVTRHRFDTPSYQKYAEGYMLTKKQMEWFWDLYLDKAEDGREPYASPLVAEDFSGLPPTLFILAEFDPLYDDGLAYAKKLETAGVPVTIQSYPTIHGFISNAHVLDIGKKAISDITQFLSSQLR